MTQPLNRELIARNLYIGVPLGPEVLQARATEWDAGMVTDADRAECYARADQLLAEEANR